MPPKPTLTLLLLALLLTACANLTASPPPTSLNQKILTAIQTMPTGGGYNGSDTTKNLLHKASKIKNNTFQITPHIAQPSFCSGATYLVLLKALNTGPETLLPTLDQQDGHGIFGRWNSNGPGAAKLITDLAAGKNFTSYDQAKPGDILKIWWTDKIGRSEQGHLVIYLSHTPETLTYWSSNQPNGYSTKTIPRTKAKRTLFTRITHPQKFANANANKLPPTDPWLANMLKQDFTWHEIAEKCKIK